MEKNDQAILPGYYLLSEIAHKIIGPVSLFVKIIDSLRQIPTKSDQPYARFIKKSSFLTKQLMLFLCSLKGTVAQFSPASWLLYEIKRKLLLLFHDLTKSIIARADQYLNSDPLHGGDIKKSEINVRRSYLIPAVIIFSLFSFAGHSFAGDLADVLKAGKLRHLGIYYANFIKRDKTGLDIELMQMFAKHLGVKYEFVESSWSAVLPDLLGKTEVRPNGGIDVVLSGTKPVKGDVIATGFTILPWRKKIVDFSEMTFPTGIWLIGNANLSVKPITPTGNIQKDIKATKSLLKGLSILTLKGSCLDSGLYGLEKTGATIELFPANRDLNGMIPSVMAGVVDTTIMDVPVALIALAKWPGDIKVLGPVSPDQGMACAFPKTSPNLRKEFNRFFRKCKADGRYKALIKKYYPSVFLYYPHFLNN